MVQEFQPNPFLSLPRQAKQEGTFVSAKEQSKVLDMIRIQKKAKTKKKKKRRYVFRTRKFVVRIKPTNVTKQNCLQKTIL